VGFELLARIAGKDPGARFELSEGAAVLCGSALHAVRSGRSYLVFLDADGRLLGGVRGIEPLAAGLVEHVEKLAGARDEDGRVRLLAAALSSAHARVRADAALELRFHPGLARHADGSVRGLLMAGLAADALVREPATVNVLGALQRLGEERAIEPIVSLFVGGRRPELDELVRDGLSSFGDEAVAERAAALAPASPQARIRQVELLERLDSPTAGHALARLASDPTDSVRARALRAVLLRKETPPVTAAADEVEAARAALAREATTRAAPRFRSVKPPNGR
jgi:hypothetical protein